MLVPTYILLFFPFIIARIKLLTYIRNAIVITVKVCHVSFIDTPYNIMLIKTVIIHIL